MREDSLGAHLVVHFHGGLVSRASAHEAASELLPAFREANTYPVFFCWNSDVWTTITANLLSIVQEQAFLRLVRRIAQMALGALLDMEGGRGTGVAVQMPNLQDLPEGPEDLERYLSSRAPVAVPHLEPLSPQQEQWIVQELAKDPVLKREQASIAAAAQPMATAGARGALSGAIPLRTRMSANVLQEISTESAGAGDRAVSVYWTLARYGAKVLKEVIARYISGRHHGLYDTVVQETLRAVYFDNLGIIAWNTMKGDTERAFEADVARFGGTAFLARLRAVWESKVRRVTLIGHSTGAIYIGRFLEHADRVLPVDARFDVVWLAPACTFRFVHDRLDLFRRRVGHLRVFGLNDDRERSYWEVPGVFRGSLLYIVAGLLEKDGDKGEVDMPLVGMQRYHTRAAPFDAPYMLEVLEFLDESPVWAVADEGDGRRSGALFHGGFDREPRTLASVQHLLLQGYGDGA